MRDYRFYSLLLLLLTVAVAAQTVAECRQEGLDPTQLACGTCDRLPTEFHTRCRACCRDLRDISSLTQPYAAAVLVVPAHAAPEEVRKLLEDDWDTLVAAKGAARLRILSSSSSGGGQAYFFSAPPVYVHFFRESAVAAAAKTPEALAAAAHESVALAGWQREDMRDMLQTLLP
jgi:hypothetical protein